MRSIELRQQRAAVLARARALVDAAEAENRNLNAEEQTQYDAHLTEMESLQQRATRQAMLEETPQADPEQRSWQLLDDQRHEPQSAEEARAQSQRAYAAAFREYMAAPSLRQISPESMDVLHRVGGAEVSPDQMRTLATMLSPQQMRALSVNSQTAGGFWIPDEMMKPIEQAMLWFGGMRQVADVITTETGADLPWPVSDDTANVGELLAESGAAGETDPTVGIRVMKAHMYSSRIVRVPYQFIQDAPINAEAWLGGLLGQRIGRVTNTHFTTRAGADGPRGLTTATTAGVTAAATGAVTSDELINLIYSLDPAYLSSRCRFMTHQNTLRDITKLKDGDGQYLFLIGNTTDRPDTIRGYPVVMNNDMPTMATGAVAIEFGDFSHYKIRDVRGFQLLRLEELYAAQLQVGFLGFSRHDGAYINAGQNAIQHIVMA